MSARRLLKKVAASGGEKAILELAMLSLDAEISGDIKLVLFDEYDALPCAISRSYPGIRWGYRRRISETLWRNDPERKSPGSR